MCENLTVQSAYWYSHLPGRWYKSDQNVRITTNGTIDSFEGLFHVNFFRFFHRFSDFVYFIFYCFHDYFGLLWLFFFFPFWFLVFYFLCVCVFFQIIKCVIFAFVCLKWLNLIYCVLNLSQHILNFVSTFLRVRRLFRVCFFPRSLLFIPTEI